MDPTLKPDTQSRRPGMRASASKMSVGKTVLERMYQVAELSRRGREMKRLVANGLRARRAG